MGISPGPFHPIAAFLQPPEASSLKSIRSSEWGKEEPGSPGFSALERAQLKLGAPFVALSH
jgi:hypothetical protein